MSIKPLRRTARALALLVATVGLARPVVAQSSYGGGITVFSDINFGGNRQTFRQDIPDLVALGLNDTISSIVVAEGEVWQICRDVNYQSECRNVSGSIADLRSMNFNDEISSIRRVNSGRFDDRRFGGVFSPADRGVYSRNTASRGTVVVYVDPNFRGRSAALNGDTPYVGPALNDRISSIEIPNGESWEVCQDANYINECTVLSGSVADLRSIGWSDRISSLRRVAGRTYRDYRGTSGVYPSNQNGLVFYDRPNFRGGATRVPQSANTAFSAGGSVQVQSGVWRVCDVRGECATIDQDVPNLAALGLVDRITSVRELNASPYYRPRIR